MREERRALITGGAGQLGRALLATCPPNWTICSYSSAELDITNVEQVAAAITSTRPTVVVNAAAWTAVDRAEEEADAAHAVNAVGAANVARATADARARLVQVSTDFVFGQGAGRPWAPGDVPDPLGVYGRTKLEGERQVVALVDGAVILRTAWVYASVGHNFVRTMLRVMAERDEVRVVADQIGSPTWASSLAGAIWAIAERPDIGGIHHWTDAGVASWYDFAVAIQEEALALGLLRRAVPIRPIRTDEYPTPARRPTYSVLDTTLTRAAIGIEPRHWRVNLREMLRELMDA